MSRVRFALLLAPLLAVMTVGSVGCESGEEPTTKFDSSDVVDTNGPAVAKGAATEVWAADNAWADKETPAAKKAGIAWEENSGLTWEEKFDRWMNTLEPIDTDRGRTFRLKTPYGDKTLPAPTLECAEVAMFLRATFASWHNLPFFLKGWDSNAKKPVFAGHFGFVYADGTKANTFPSFKNAYKDHQKTWKVGDAWPKDATLRSRHLGDDDTLVFEVEGEDEPGAGVYFDEIFLNKRVGYFARLLLLYFGSANLADGANMFHVEADAAQGGDVLIERWQKKGIGHVLPLLKVESPLEGKLAITIASGSMPRRIPRWDEPLTGRRYFTDNYTGGVGEASDGTPYAKLGGGLRRWRTAVLKGGRWVNAVSAESQADAIEDSDLEGISSRPARFDEILVSGTVEEQVAAITQRIAQSREHLRSYPASCSARTNREIAFTELRGIASRLGKTEVELEAEYRTVEDFVFAELEYTASKTCCWNSSTAKMAEVVLDYARVEQDQAEADGVCVEPTVFAAREDGYALWQAHATSMGLGSEWKAWSEDEPCEQRAVVADTATELKGTAYCALPEVGGDTTDDQTDGDDTEG
jgi:hypothetical protein